MHTVYRSPLVDHLANLPSHIQQSVWTGSALGAAHGQVVPSGHAELDAELPGGGWPVGAVVELLQAQHGLGEWRLLMPALRRVTQQGGSVLLIGPPYPPFLPSLQREGIDAGKVIWVQAQTQAQRLWAAEQAAKAACVTAVLTWLPQARPEHMRRLQSCAMQHPGLLFALRPLAARQESSASPLRVAMSLEANTPNTSTNTPTNALPHALNLDIVKRKGPLLARTLSLSYWHKGLAHLIKQVPHVALDRVDTRTAAEHSLDDLALH